MRQGLGKKVKVLCIDKEDGACIPRLVAVAELLRAAGRQPGTSRAEQAVEPSRLVLRWEVGHNHIQVFFAVGGRTVPLRLQPVQKKCLLACSVFSFLGETVTPEQLAEMKGANYAISAVYARITEIRRAITNLGLGVKGKDVLQLVEGAYRIALEVAVVFPNSLAFPEAHHYFCYLRGSALRRRFEGQPKLVEKFARFARERGLGGLLDQ